MKYRCIKTLSIGKMPYQTVSRAFIQVNVLQRVDNCVFTINNVQAEKTAHLTPCPPAVSVSVSNFAHTVSVAVTVGLGGTDALVTSTAHSKQLKCVHVV